MPTANDVMATLEIEKEGAWKQEHPRASSITGCAREMYHQIADWPMKPAPPPALRERFRRGHEVEAMVKRRLGDAGWEVVGGQQPFEIVEDGLVIVTGHIDGRLRMGSGLDVSGGEVKTVASVYHPGTVFEVKSLHPSVWARIEKLGDFFHMASFWHRYPRQMLAYLWGHGEEHGLLVLDDCMGHLKVIDVNLWDWTDETEALLRQCREVAQGVATKQKPDYTENRKLCIDCWCREVGVCTPAIDFRTPGGVIHDPDMAETLGEMAELREQYKRYQELDKGFKATVKATIKDGDYVCGDYTVTRKTQQRKNGPAVVTTWNKIVENGTS